MHEMYELTLEEQRDYDETEKRIEKEAIEQNRKDKEVLDAIKNQVPSEVFEEIEQEIIESEHTTNFRIIETPIGQLQYPKTDGLKVWVDQYGSDDFWAGVVCVELPDGKYLAWDYWM